MTTEDLHGYYFEDLFVGMTAGFGKTITEADVVMFSAVSGDINPSHINEEFAEFETTCRVGETTVVDGPALIWVPSRGD
jgi:acyl dehydratase